VPVPDGHGHADNIEGYPGQRIHLSVRPVQTLHSNREHTMTIKRFHVGARMSAAVVHNGTIYLAGEVAEDPSQDTEGQTRQILASIDRLLAECGSDKTRILSAQIFLADIADFKAMNSVWDTWVPAGHTPARATVEAKLATPKYRVEIKVIAAA